MTPQAPEKTAVAVKANGKPKVWEPFRGFDALQDEMNQLMNRFWSFGPMPTLMAKAPLTELAAWAPRMDVFERDGKMIAKVELPGAKKEDIEVALDNGDLVVRGERKAEHETKEANYYRQERSYGSFYRRFPLPTEVKPDQIQANFMNGVLEVTVPLPTAAKPEAQKIAIT